MSVKIILTVYVCNAMFVNALFATKNVEYVISTYSMKDGNNSTSTS